MKSNYRVHEVAPNNWAIVHRSSIVMTDLTMAQADAVLNLVQLAEAGEGIYAEELEDARRDYEKLEDESALVEARLAEAEALLEPIDPGATMRALLAESKRERKQIQAVMPQLETDAAAWRAHVAKQDAVRRKRADKKELARLTASIMEKTNA